MFTVNLRRAFNICDKIVIRNLRGGRVAIGPNPGLDKRLKAYEEDGFKFEDNDAEEFIEQSESTFYNVGEAYGKHLKETSFSKTELRHHIVKEKYFKNDMPNLLTWSEKEQIRHLVSEHPDEWTPEKIAESFPVTAAVVKKLLKFPWKPSTEQRIARHDASAMRNWRELKEGTLDIPEKLREHFMKFSDRSIPPLNRKSITDDLTQEEKLGEFARIIERCAKQSETKQEQKVWTENDDTEIQKHKVYKSKNYKRTTLDGLTTAIKNRIESGSEVDLPDKIILDTVTTVHPTEVAKENISEIQLYNDKHNESTELAEYKETDNRLFVGGNYPQRIRIPKKSFKKGATYKVNDCFYDDDGRFLYRVIGMTSN